MSQLNKILIEVALV